jgi:glycopeptide antibiotics resistance protein
MEAVIKEVIDMSWPTVVIVCCLIIILRVTYFFKNDKKRICFHEEINNLLFVAYILVLFELVTKHDMSGGGINLVPFQEISRYEIGSYSFFRQVFGNILLFVPFGYFASRFCKLKNISTIFIVSTLSSLTIESVQMFIGRSFDVDDIILNVVGGVLGFIICKVVELIRNKLPKIIRKEWFYNLISIIVIVLITLYLISIL